MLKKRLVLYPPGGSDLVNCFRVLGICLRKDTWKIGRHGFWESAKPSVLAANGSNITVPWNDDFVEDVRRTFQACGIFCFCPIQAMNDGGLGISASALSTMLTTNGTPNDLVQNFNALSIITFAPILSFGPYLLLCKYGIRYGVISRITTGLFLSSVGGVAYTVLNYYAYKTGPCGDYGSSGTCVNAQGVSLVSSISIWWTAIPHALGGISELFVNVGAYSIAYSRAPVNMRGLVTALNLLIQGINYAIGLALTSLIKDPYLTWDFGWPAIAGFVLTALFYNIFHHIDKEEYLLSRNDVRDIQGLRASLEGGEPHQMTIIDDGPGK